MTLHNSAFSHKTRYLRTEINEFRSSKMPMNQDTWSFTSIEKNFPSVMQACELLARQLGHRVQCNGYFTPRGAQGLPIHYDLHDVFVLQIEGSKDWKVWPAFRKNISYETLVFDEKENLTSWTSSPPSKNLRLFKKQGLYLKKGEPHVAIATLEDSFHLSFGIYHD